MSTVRINKFFTEQGFCSRRAADRMIEEGRVRINGRVAVLGDQVTDADVVTVDRPYSLSFLKQLEKGVLVLREKTRPCRTKKEEATTFRITLTEGRNRQIRRMCSALGYRVVTLVRIRIMHIRLGELPVGKWRHLTPKEREELLTAVGLHGEESKAAS